MELVEATEIHEVADAQVENHKWSKMQQPQPEDPLVVVHFHMACDLEAVVEVASSTSCWVETDQEVPAVVAAAIDGMAAFDFVVVALVVVFATFFVRDMARNWDSRLVLVVIGVRHTEWILGLYDYQNLEIDPFYADYGHSFQQ